MVRYLVKVTMMATPENKNFAGQMCYCYSGKNGETIANVGENAKAVHFYRKAWPSAIAEYGYKRECDARRSWDYNNPQNDKHWTSRAEIVKVIIPDKGVSA